VEKSCVAKGINGKIAKEKYFIIANKYALSPNIFNAWMFAMFKNVIHSQLLKPSFCPEPLRNSDLLLKIIKLQNRLLLL